MSSTIFEQDELYLEPSRSLASDFISPWHETRYHDMGAMQLWWDSADAIDGTFIVQFSLDKVHWNDSIEATDAATVCSATGGAYFDFPDITCNYWRIKYTANSITTGTVTILSSIKRRR